MVEGGSGEALEVVDEGALGGGGRKVFYVVKRSKLVHNTHKQIDLEKGRNYFNSFLPFSEG